MDPKPCLQRTKHCLYLNTVGTGTNVVKNPYLPIEESGADAAYFFIIFLVKRLLKASRNPPAFSCPQPSIIIFPLPQKSNFYCLYHS